MKFEDVKKGMKLKRIGSTNMSCKNGGIYTVSGLNKYNSEHLSDGVAFKELSPWYSLKFFEPAYKFEIGDEVMFNDLSSFKAKILFIDKDDYCTCYLVKIDEDRNGKSHLMLKAEETLSPLKKKDKLEAGDRIKSKSERMLKILHVHEGCDVFNEEKIEYFCEILDGSFKGRNRIILIDEVDEIIYDWENNYENKKGRVKMGNITEEAIKKMGDELCEFCPWTDFGERKMITAPHNLCEGIECNLAYEHYLDAMDEEC